MSAPPRPPREKGSGYAPTSPMTPIYAAPVVPVVEVQDATFKSDRFRDSAEWQDVWCLILYLIVMGSFIAMAGFCLSKLTFTSDPSSIWSDTVCTNFFLILGVSALVGFGLSLLYLVLIHKAAGILIYVTIVGSVLLWLGGSIYFFIIGVFGAAILCLLFSLLSAFIYFLWRRRIPFAVVMLKTVTHVTGKYPATIVAAVVGLLVGIVFYAFWVLVMLGAFQTWGNSTASWVSFLVYAAFVLYWNAQIIKNVVHVTVSGVFASHYLRYDTGQMPRQPTARAARRALSYSFGSICFGSLIIALIQTVRTLVRSLLNDNSILRCCLDCILGCIDSLVQYFNQYAYTQVAIYGKSYCRAAKDTWHMLKHRGIDAIINDDLVGTVLIIGAILIGLICAVIAGVWSWVVFKDDSNETLLIVLCTVAAFFVGVVMSAVVTEVVESGVATTFVVFGEEPVVMQRVQPELYAKIYEVYPQCCYV